MRSSGARRYDQAQLPVLLAIRHSAHLPSRPILVHPCRADVPEVAGQQSKDLLGNFVKNFLELQNFNNSVVNEQVPDFVKEKRFANWLRDARDWAVSRNRYWGTPIPLWMSDDGEEVVCVGSIAELKELSGVELTDLHREHVDVVTIPSKRPGKPPLRRVTEVFDCWFESGSMPYAQVHYPFERRKEFEEGFPADFIAEGIDQTRGWFYTLLVLSTALYDKPPFKNLIVNGLVLAADGQKMSKIKKNYPDPMGVVGKYSADALRLYLINSPVVRAENLRFKEEGVRDIIKDVFLPWYNAYRFFVQNLQRLERVSIQTNSLKKICKIMQILSNSLKTTGGRCCVRRRSRQRVDRWLTERDGSLDPVVHAVVAALHAAGDGCVPAVHGRAASGAIRRPLDQLVRPHEPQAPQGRHRQR